MKKLLGLWALFFVLSTDFALAAKVTPLQEAIIKGEEWEALGEIYDDIDINELSESGKTALDYAVANLLDIDEHFIALLIQLGAKTSEELRQD